MRRVSLFITCLADVFYPQVGQSVVEVLERCGVSVDFPQKQTCCGQPAYNSGYHSEARLAAINTIEAFADSETVIAPSGSCVSMIRHYYPTLFQNDPEWQSQAIELANKTYEFTEYLVQVLGIQDLGAAFPAKAAFHSSCHMSRGLGLNEEPRQLLQKVEGLVVEDLPYCQDCCGFGGTFSAKMSEISEAMVDEKIKHFESTGASVLIGADLGCLMNIEGRMHRLGRTAEVLHVAEILAKGRGNS